MLRSKKKTRRPGTVRLELESLEVRAVPSGKLAGFSSIMLNPQPLPPRYSYVLLNPQPLPPKIM